jgi:hypothetical protein
MGNITAYNGSVTVVKSFIILAPTGCMGPGYVLSFYAVKTHRAGHNSSTAEAREK